MNEKTSIIGTNETDVIDKVRQYVQEIRHKETPKARIKYRPGKKGMQYKYIDRIYACECLDENYPLWQFNLIPKSYEEINSFVQIMGTLKVIDPTTKQVRSFTCMGQEEIRYEKDNSERINNEYAKMAETDCLKRCASMLGLFNDVYSDDIDIYKDGNPNVNKSEDEEIFVTKVIPEILKLPLEANKILLQIYSFYTGKANLQLYLDNYKITE